jgi:hypothetical protein
MINKVTVRHTTVTKNCALLAIVLGDCVFIIVVVTGNSEVIITVTERTMLVMMTST